MGSPVTRKPDFSSDRAAELLCNHFGVDGSLSILDGERDLNFKVTVDGASRYVLKIANPDEDPRALEVQEAALEALHAADIQGCPRTVRTIDDASSVTVEHSGGTSIVRLLTWVPGTPLAEILTPSEDLLADVGRLLGRVDAGLSAFPRPEARRPFEWNLEHAVTTVRDRAANITGDDRRRLVESHLAHAEEKFQQIPALRRCLLHNDGNDWNVLVTRTPFKTPRAAGVIDFGDVTWTWAAAGPAVAMAYVMMNKADPVAAGRALLAGYHEARPLLEDEVNLVWELARWRLLISVAMSARQRKEAPDNAYLAISETPAWELLFRMETIHPRLAAYAMRDACGFEPCPTSPRLRALIASHGHRGEPILPDLGIATTHVLDLSVSAPGLGATDDSMATISRRVAHEIADAGATVGVGRYDEVRRCYAGDLFAAPTDTFPERRTVHLGIDLFAPAGTCVHAPLDGEVWSVRDNEGHLDYGPTVILRHRHPDIDGPFFTLYGHLARTVIGRLRPGSAIGRGQAFAEIGTFPENGDWPPHVHFQVMPDILDDALDPTDRRGEFAGVAAPSQRALWRSLCPDPSALLGLGPEARAPADAADDDLIAFRSARIPSNLSVSYATPLQIVRGEGAYLYDVNGQAYLDGVNNVCHVGHGHPRVTAALTAQASVLNTNTRYLHPNLTAYADRLAGLFPAPLEVVFLCCSGSEANELALRLARTATGRHGVCVLDHAYHGNTGNLVDLSPYKHDGPGGDGHPEWVEPVRLGDPWDRSGPHGDAPAWPPGVDAALGALERRGQSAAALLVEALPGCAGQVELPNGYLDRAFTIARSHGALCIADEVQTGFGRVGSHWWAFETQDVIPDIVTMGKPIGNGHPMAAVVTTRAIADAFANGMEWFNTFGGNPVSCAVGMAVLDIIEDEELRANAARIGGRLKRGLEDLQKRFPLIGDVRGRGLFLGAELVRDRETREPATAEASWIVNNLRDRGILLSTDGPHANVLKVKPPLVWTEADANRVVRALEQVLIDP